MRGPQWIGNNFVDVIDTPPLLTKCKERRIGALECLFPPMGRASSWGQRMRGSMAKPGGQLRRHRAARLQHAPPVTPASMGIGGGGVPQVRKVRLCF
jgi:hypothetical protein